MNFTTLFEQISQSDYVRNDLFSFLSHPEVEFSPEVGKTNPRDILNYSHLLNSHFFIFETIMSNYVFHIKYNNVSNGHAS